MEDKVLEELQLHQNAAKRDSGSPLFLIREKEMEISGRVLAARQEAERKVSEGRRKAAEVLAKAEAEAEQAARDHETKLLADAEERACKTREDVTAETGPLEAQCAERHDKAVDAIVALVTQV